MIQHLYNVCFFYYLLSIIFMAPVKSLRFSPPVLHPLSSPSLLVALAAQILLSCCNKSPNFIYRFNLLVLSSLKQPDIRQNWVYFHVLTCISWMTDAPKGINDVNTGCPIHTGIRFTLVDVNFTLDPWEPWWTLAVKVIKQVEAGAIVVAWLTLTLIHLRLALLTWEKWRPGSDGV